MRPFEYVSPTGIEQVPALLGPKWGANEILAGGTDLLSLMKDDVVTPKRLVNVKQIEALRGISVMKNGLRIGALALLQDVADNDLVRGAYPALAEACADAASPQIRNMATIGGNLCQRPRCWYFRNGYGLLAIKDGKSLVEEGDNRYHAILGNQGPAKFVSPSSIAPILIAYGAWVSIQGGGKPRSVLLEKFFVTPKEEGEREHDLVAHEMITEIMLPATSWLETYCPPGAKFCPLQIGMLPRGPSAFANYEVRQKYSFDWPLATAAVKLDFESPSVVIGHVAPVPWVSEEAAQVLKGKTISEELASAAADAAVAKATPLSRNAYKVQLARVAVKRAILAAAKGRA